MRSGLQRVWSSVVIGCFTALAFLVLSYSPATLSATGSGDCAVSPSSQKEGWCCSCDGWILCPRDNVIGFYDRCEGGSPTWCPDEENCTPGGPD